MQWESQILVWVASIPWRGAPGAGRNCKIDFNIILQSSCFSFKCYLVGWWPPPAPGDMAQLTSDELSGKPWPEVKRGNIASEMTVLRKWKKYFFWYCCQRMTFDVIQPQPAASIASPMSLTSSLVSLCSLYTSKLSSQSLKFHLNTGFLRKSLPDQNHFR